MGKPVITVYKKTVEQEFSAFFDYNMLDKQPGITVKNREIELPTE